MIFYIYTFGHWRYQYNMVARWGYENWDPDNLGPTYQFSLQETKVDFFLSRDISSMSSARTEQ